MISTKWSGKSQYHLLEDYDWVLNISLYFLPTYLFAVGIHSVIDLSVIIMHEVYVVVTMFNNNNNNNNNWTLFYI